MNEKIESMNGTSIIKAAMFESKTTQNILYKRMGYEGQGTISKMVNSPRMSLESFTKMLSAMGYEVIVHKVKKDEENGIVNRTAKWKVNAPEYKEEV